MPKLSIVATPIQDAIGDVSIIPVDTTLTISNFFSHSVAQEVRALMQKVKFQGKWGSAELFIAPKALNVPFIAVIGTGEAGISPERRAEGIRRALASVILNGRGHVLRDISIASWELADLSSALESVFLTDYWFSDYSANMKKEQEARRLRSVTFCIQKDADIAQAKKIVQRSERVGAAVTLTRTLINQPASHMSPKILVAEARKIKKESSRISLTVMDKKQAQKKNFSAFLAVARGSKEEPYVIHLQYKPKKNKAQGKVKKIAIIGKGITFDSGGLSLKPAQYMENMKIDMAGAATVLGLFSLLEHTKPNVEVHGIILACENMPSGDAYRPGDVIPTMSGKTIEVLNTDAEGRITLADALTYARMHKMDAMIDLASLTGACVVALGDTHAGLFGNNEALNASLMNSAKEVGEGLVEFPLPEEYRPTIQSYVADVRNTSLMKTGGAITAALFLQEFVGDTPWAHLDIAGPIYAEQPLIPYWQFGATGYGVRTLARFVETYEG